MRDVVLSGAQSVIGEAALPNLSTEPQVNTCPARVAALDELQAPFQSDASRSKNEVKVIGHEGEVMEQVTLLGSIVQKNLQEELGHAL